jgi:hypothetical protein
MTTSYKISEISIKYLSNANGDKIEELKSSQFLSPNNDGTDASALKEKLNDYPYFCHYVPYSDRRLEILKTHDDIVKTFFDKTIFIQFINNCAIDNKIATTHDDYLKEYTHFAENPNEEKEKATAHRNIRIMLKWLFPMSFPLYRDFKKRIDFQKTETIIDKSLTRNVGRIMFNFISRWVNDEYINQAIMKKYCYLNVGSRKCTLIHGEWYTGFTSHPVYYEIYQKLKVYKDVTIVAICKDIFSKLFDSFYKYQKARKGNPVQDFEGPTLFGTYIKHFLTELKFYTGTDANKELPDMSESERKEKITKYLDTKYDETYTYFTTHKTMQFNFKSSDDYQKFKDKMISLIVQKNPSKSQSKPSDPLTRELNNMLKLISLFFYSHNVVKYRDMSKELYKTDNNLESRDFIDPPYKNYIALIEYIHKNISQYSRLPIESELKTYFTFKNSKYLNVDAYLIWFEGGKSRYVGINEIYDSNGSFNKYEIHLRLNVVGGIVSKTTEKFAKCAYESQKLGNTFDTLKKENLLKEIRGVIKPIDVTQYFVDLTDAIQSGLKNQKQAKAKEIQIAQEKAKEKENKNVQFQNNPLNKEEPPSSTNYDNLFSQFLPTEYNGDIDALKKLITDSFSDMLTAVSQSEVETNQKIKEKIITSLNKAKQEKQLEDSRKTTTDPAAEAQHVMKSNMYSAVIKFIENIQTNEQKKQMSITGGKKRYSTRKQKKRLSHKTKKHRTRQ